MKRRNADNRQQLALEFEPGLTQQFPRYMDLIANVVYSSRMGLNGVAAHLDKSPSQLSRMLNKNPDDLRHLPAEDIAGIIECTGDHRPIYWEIEKFLEDPETKRRRAIDQLSRLLPAIQAAVEGAK